jgi:hypothetical protein
VCAQDYSTKVGVDLDQIDDDLQPASQMRVKLDDEAVESYAEILDSLPPVLLMYDPTTLKHWVVDGGHRLTAAKLKKRTKIQANVKAGSYLDAFKEAARVNAANPVRVTNADKRHRVEVAMTHPEMSKWSNRRIAEACGVAHDTVNRLRPESQLDESSSSATVGRDGKARKPPKPRKSKPSGNSAPQPEASTPPTPASQPVDSSPESNVTPPIASDDSKPPDQTDKQRVNGLFTDDATTTNSTESEEESEIEAENPVATDDGLIDWDELWEPEERLILQRYREWPEGAGAAFVMRLEMLAIKLRRKYHPEIQMKNNLPLL